MTDYTDRHRQVETQRHTHTDTYTDETCFYHDYNNTNLQYQV